jgi:hypothetical protein
VTDHPLNHLYLAYTLVDAGERGRARDELARACVLCQAERFGDFAARWREEASARVPMRNLFIEKRRGIYSMPPHDKQPCPMMMADLSPLP